MKILRRTKILKTLNKGSKSVVLKSENLQQIKQQHTSKDVKFEDVSNFSEDVTLLSKNNDKIIFKRKEYVFDYDKYFKQQIFDELYILVKYIEFRNTNLIEDELMFIFQKILDQKWEKTLTQEHQNAVFILMEVLEKIYFSHFDILYLIITKASKIGLLTSKEVLNNTFVEINRNLFSNVDNEQQKYLFSYNNFRSHNVIKFYNEQDAKLNDKKIVDLQSLCNQLSIHLQPKEEKYQDLYEKYEYKDKFYVFDKQNAKKIQKSENQTIDNLLDIVEVIYQQFTTYQELVFQKIEAEQPYQNFDNNFTRFMNYFNINQLQRYLEIIKNVVLQIDLNKLELKNEKNFLFTLFNSQKFDVVDIKYYDFHKQVKTENIVFYYYIISKLQTESLLIKHIDEIFLSHEQLQNNFLYFSIIIKSINAKKIESKDLWIFLNYFFVEFYTSKKSFLEQVNEKLFIEILKCFIDNFQTRELWLSLESYQFAKIKNFRLLFKIYTQKFFYNCITESDIQFIKNLDQIYDYHSIFDQCNLQQYIQNFQFLQYVVFENINKNKMSEDQIRKYCNIINEFLQIYKDDLTSVQSSLQLDILIIYYQFLYISISSQKSNSWLKTQEEVERNVMDYFSQNTQQQIRKLLTHLTKRSQQYELQNQIILYLTIGKFKVLLNTQQDIFQFFRRKIYKQCMQMFLSSTSQENFNVLQICYYTNYFEDEVLFNILEFNLLRDLDLYNFNQICQIIYIYVQQYINIDLSNKQEFLDLKQNFMISILKKAIEILQKSDWDVYTTQFQSIDMLQKSIELLTQDTQVEQYKKLQNEIQEILHRKQDDFNSIQLFQSRLPQQSFVNEETDLYDFLTVQEIQIDKNVDDIQRLNKIKIYQNRFNRLINLREDTNENKT